MNWRSAILLLLCMLMNSVQVSADGVDTPAQRVSGFDHSYSDLNLVFKRYIHQGEVDYTALKSQPDVLNLAVHKMEQVTEAEFQQWSSVQQQAYLINLYNAATLQLIIENYPIDSIKKIGGWFRKPWSIDFIQLFGKSEDLDHIEHDLLRQNYQEPRVHFALVCAAKGCPPIRKSAYTPDNLSAQLDEQGHAFFAQSSKNNVDAERSTVNISPIFDWFKEDFGSSREQVLAFVTPYFSKDQQEQIDADRFVIRYTDYDWALNDVPHE